MSETDKPQTGPGRPPAAAVFVNMVLQQANMALMFLGKTPHPETNQPIRDLEAAQMFIDQLEVLETKTKGNLDPQEQSILKQALTSVRMAFVEAAREEPGPKTPSPGQAAAPSGAPEARQTAPGAQGTPSAEQSQAQAEAESRKKFSKKY